MGLANIFIGMRLDTRKGLHIRFFSKQVRKAFLRFEVFLDGHLMANGKRRGNFIVFGFEYRKHSRLLGKPGKANGVVRGITPT